MPHYAFNELSFNDVPTHKDGIDCKGQADFGELTYIINGNKYTLESDEWIYPPELKHDQLKCKSGLMEMNLKHDMFVLGDIFMRKFYTVFDREHDRVGFAPAVHK